MSKRQAQRQRGKYKERRAALLHEREHVPAIPLSVVLEEIRRNKNVTTHWRNPYVCPLCGQQRNVAFFETERCDACRDRAYWLGELLHTVLGVPWTMNDYGILPSWVIAAIQGRGEE